ncbi:MAG: formylglycine-generating enzyme family protein [Bacteroidales bacterium]|jgi:formylglycine-generating enzyme required for sulfatase activity|nr:formylglycine-generating enzyme family protein [Bacteroidales bacterium]
MIKNFLLTGIITLFALHGIAQEQPEMVSVPGGSFWMGNDYTYNTTGVSDEAPEHKVTIKSFKMAKTEVTFELYDIFCEATGYEKPSDGNKGRGNLPVYNVSWEAAVMFCNWLSKRNHLDKYYEVKRDSTNFKATPIPGSKGYRLPTEAEWEYAARGGEKGKTYSYSGSNDYNKVAWCKNNSQLTPHAVATKEPNELGIYDMTGNAWEWCYDFYDKAYYKKSPENDPQGPETGTDRVYRGGSWTSNPEDLRMTSRHSFSQNKEYGMIGIRLAQDE